MRRASQSMNQLSGSAVRAGPAGITVDATEQGNGRRAASLRPRTVIAAPLYNHADYLPAALDSLLAQTDSDFALLLVDDGSQDQTPNIARRYEERDPRVTFHANAARLGLAGNWRRSFELARELYPDAEYFAWGSDHDLWHPRWLETLRAELDERPEVVLAYPTCERITAEGDLSHRRGGFETVGVATPAARLRLGCRFMHAGDMVYGLLRADSLDRAGVFRPVLEPDRLLMAELAVQGRFRHVDEALWQRRFVGTAVRARQRRAIFPRRRPLYSWLAPWIVRPAVFLWVYAVRGAGDARIGRRQGVGLAVSYALASNEQVVQRWWARARKRWARARKRMARARKRVRRRAMRTGGLALRYLRRVQRGLGHLPARTGLRAVALRMRPRTLRPDGPPQGNGSQAGAGQRRVPTDADDGAEPLTQTPAGSVVD
jgi:glycosyltransferase involved in cell wall biosynthesis